MYPDRLHHPDIGHVALASVLSPRESLNFADNIWLTVQDTHQPVLHEARYVRVVVSLGAGELVLVEWLVCVGCGRVQRHQGSQQRGATPGH